LTSLAALAPARAVVLSENELAETSLSIGAVARSFAFTLHGEPLRPPLAPEDLDPSGFGIFDLRLYAVRQTPRLKLVAHLQLTTLVRAHPLTGGVAVGRGVAPPRWLPMSFELADDPTIEIAAGADWLYAAYSIDRFTVTLGRQPVTLGRGAIWSPIDLVATFALTEVDTEYKPGADALRVDYSPDARSALTFLASTGELEDDHDLGAALSASTVLVRYTRGWDRGEVGATAAYVRGDAVLGADGVVDTGSFEIYGEATLTLVTDDSVVAALVTDGQIVPKAMVGATFRTSHTLTLRPELHHNDFGATEPADYLAVAASDRVALGEQIVLGRDYAAIAADWELHPLVHLGGLALVNALDPSALLSLGLRYNLADNAELYLGGYLPVGRTPYTPLAPKDEFGQYPALAFAELKAAL
jgi:hypothetical protein